MMKVYINIKRNSNLRLHQPFNKRIGLMKRERTHRTLHHFSFGERFDETMMNVYHYGYQSIILSIHRIFIHQQVCRTNGRKEMPLSADRSVGHPTCLLSDRPTREGVSYRRQEKVCLYRWYSHRLLETEKP